MTNARCRSRWLLGLGVAWLAVPACGTQEVRPHPVTYVDVDPGPDRGGLMIVFASTAATFEEDQARGLSNPSLTSYHLFMDGSQLAFPDVDGYGTSYPITFLEGNHAGAGYVAAGTHHFAIAEAGGGATIFAGDADIPTGSVTRLYLFGPSGALQARFVSHPEIPPPGMLHVSAMNLVRSGAHIEVVSCSGATVAGTGTDCLSLSPPLALGESFDADFAAAVVPEPSARGLDDRLADGAGVYFRAVPTAAAPAPPAQPFFRGVHLSGSIPAPPANLVAAPNYMAADGSVQSFYN
jgi:hypothetical protein